MTKEQELNLIINVVLGEATDKENELFQKWLAADLSHLSKYEEIRKIYQAGEALSGSNRDWDADKSWNAIVNKIKRKTLRRRSIMCRLVTYAAAIILLLFAGGIYLIEQKAPPTDVQPAKAILILGDGKEIPISNENLQIEQNNIQVSNDPELGLKYNKIAPQQIKAPINRLVIPKGGDYQLHLADGTKIWLNSESELSFPAFFDGDKREVTLKGEAFFEVTKNPEKPFYVKTNLLSVKVYGTSFNVASYPTEKTIKTTLVEGSVSIIQDDQEYKIKPSEQLIYDKIHCQSEIKVVDTNLYIQWRTGKYYFNNLELSEIMSQIQRWYDLDVRYESENLKYHRFTGVIYKPNSIQYSLDILSKATELKFNIKGNTIHIEK